ncbi:MAG: ribonuclease H-like domain-containing protein, partial [Promethearchaeota archaeon]
KTRSAILKNMSLIKGIGEKSKKILCSRGYKTIPDLIFHERKSYRIQAREITDAVINFRLESLKKIKNARDLDLLFCFSPEKIAYLDIETNGLSNANVFLVAFGFMDPSENSFKCIQFFAHDTKDELAVIKRSLELLREFDCIVTFNGKRFDVPMLEERARYFFNQDLTKLIKHHVDLYYEIPKFLNIKRRVRLSWLEKKVLNFARIDDVSSHIIPEIYERFRIASDNGMIGCFLQRFLENTFNLSDKKSAASLFKAKKIDVLHEICRIVKHNILDVVSLHDLLITMLLNFNTTKISIPKPLLL